ncbi:hypothetical protein [Marinobacter sp. CA1]|uniref:hypothetical protein n=1 Tax=Marinobacter sp. CA1 TaxID=2817656 RepID=UPI001D07450E|nr:hypothetical protein [Marinobacter sp. CA1]UDL05458.1 hypothetical protein J2887_01395 [Marinobacter sp. CA1]
MNIVEIIEKRGCGELRINFATNWNYSTNQILSGFGLFPNEENLIEVTIEVAREIVETLLWRDLAYSGEIMSKNDAIKYSEYLIYSQAPRESTFYTNAEWQKYHQTSSFSSKRFTNSTFDGGVLCVGKDSSMSIWVEDED